MDAHLAEMKIIASQYRSRAKESQAILCFNPSKYAKATYLFFVAEVCNENRVSFQICETKSDYRFKELQRKRVIVANICNDIV